MTITLDISVIEKIEQIKIQSEQTLENEIKNMIRQASAYEIAELLILGDAGLRDKVLSIIHESRFGESIELISDKYLVDIFIQDIEAMQRIIAKLEIAADYKRIVRVLPFLPEEACLIISNQLSTHPFFNVVSDIVNTPAKTLDKLTQIMQALNCMSELTLKEFIIVMDSLTIAKIVSLVKDGDVLNKILSLMDKQKLSSVVRMVTPQVYQYILDNTDCRRIIIALKTTDTSPEYK